MAHAELFVEYFSKETGTRVVRMATHVEQARDFTFVVMHDRFPDDDWKIDLEPGDELNIQRRAR